jgi:hypothetical protein
MMTAEEKAKAKIAFLEMVAEKIFSVMNTAMLPIYHPNINNVSHTATGRSFKNQWGNRPLRGYDIDLLVDGKVVRLRFIEQNPDKKDGMGNFSTYAQLARQGHRIVWVINRDTDEWPGRVQDGKWIPSQARAYSTSKPANPRQAQDQYGQGYNLNNGEWVNNLTNVAPADITNFVEESAEVEGL